MPFRSEQQRRLFYALRRKGEMSQHTIDKWNEETKQKQDGKPLPRRVKQAAAALVPPEEVRAAARRGLAARRAAPQSQRGGLTASQASAQGIGSGVVRAQTLASGRGVSPETVKRMHSFFSRHRKNKDTPRGRIAWDLWGGDPGARWAASQVAAMKSSTTTSSAKSHAMKTMKTAASMEQTLQGAISGAIGGALIGSRRSLDDAVVRGMVQGAVTGALAGGAAAQATRDQRAHFGAGVVGGYLGSRGPRGESRPQVHVRMDRHNTGTPESFVTEKHAAASELRRRRHEKIAEGNFGHGAELAGLAMLAAPSIQHFRKKPMSDRTSHKINAAGLAVLAAPSLLELAKRHKKTASDSSPDRTKRRRLSQASAAMSLASLVPVAIGVKRITQGRPHEPAAIAGMIMGGGGLLLSHKAHKKTAANQEVFEAAVEQRHQAGLRHLADQVSVQKALGYNGARSVNDAVVHRHLVGQMLGIGAGAALYHRGHRGAALASMLAGNIGGLAWGTHAGLKKQRGILMSKGIDANGFGRIRSMTPEAEKKYR